MDVLENKDSFTDIAFKYQFTNYETFMRGFQRFFGVTPSEFKEQRKVHMLQWKRRLSMEYLNHLNGHNYLRPTRVSLEDTIVGGHIINDRHFFLTTMEEIFLTNSKSPPMSICIENIDTYMNMPL